jgi:hypothetical protein
LCPRDFGRLSYQARRAPAARFASAKRIGDLLDILTFSYSAT